MKKILTTFVVILLLLNAYGQAWAQEASGSSAALNSAASVAIVDNRAEVLKQYLQNQDSPLAPFASDFVASADKYNLDWRLVASIAGLESTFGKHIPANSYNGWGWGVYGTNVKRFNSWSEGIETISQGLRENYLKDNPDSNPYVIGPTYAASPTWAQRVTYFMDQMEEYRMRNAKSTLSLAL